MPWITRNYQEFLAQIIAQNSGKLFNYGAEFSSFKLKHVIFRIPELHSGMKEVPLDFDIPQSLNSL